MHMHMHMHEHYICVLLYTRLQSVGPVPMPYAMPCDTPYVRHIIELHCSCRPSPVPVPISRDVMGAQWGPHHETMGPPPPPYGPTAATTTACVLLPLLPSSSHVAQVGGDLDSDIPTLVAEAATTSTTTATQMELYIRTHTNT